MKAIENLDLQEPDQPNLDWKTLRESIMRFIQSRGVAKSLAEDLTQETLIKISKKIDSLKETDRIVPWTHRIARNVIADHFRKKDRELPLNIAEDESPKNETINVNATVASWLDNYIDNLSEIDKTLIKLTELGNMSQKAAAERLGLSYSATKSRIQRARAKIKRDLLECCKLELDSRGNVIEYEKRDCDCCD